VSRSRTIRSIPARIILLVLGVAALYWWITSSGAAELRVIIAGWWVHGVMGL